MRTFKKNSKRAGMDKDFQQIKYQNNKLWLGNSGRQSIDQLRHIPTFICNMESPRKILYVGKIFKRC